MWEAENTWNYIPRRSTQNRQDKAMNLTNFLSCWHNVSHLILGRYFLKVLASGTRAESLPTRLTNLRYLYFFDYNFDGEDQIFPLLRILRSCPSLKILQFLSSQGKKDDKKVDVNYFEEPDCTAQGFNNLQTLHINKFYGSRTELRFVRFILGSAPLLRKAILLVDSSINESQSLKISKELMRFPRASPKSEIVFEPWSKVQTRLVLRC
ncbi:F-box/FBD/LRR-repeat protein At1g13570-like [Nicotiana tomentosiformis]|uniref:F-box/FBD/LRR-repeat protein At1g13570-like n=1 Tax=Nicotiana tomentosiformis TaxID=4098 RepID=UPI00051B75BD